MKVSLSEVSTRAPKEFDKAETKEKIIKIQQELQEMQNLLFAEGKHSILIVLQGLDASGKDGAIKNVFSAVNPMGVNVTPFKVPTEEELKHDFLWRIHLHTPAKGMIQIFNRSHYEDILVTRVHKLIDDATAKKRMKAINHFEELLVEHNNTSILKFYLHISQEKQKERLDERLSDVRKKWKYNKNDLAESQLWDRYMEVYQDCFENCSEVPWNIVPADQNWYKEYVIASTVLETLKGFNMHYPELKEV
jgi:PPK2 family polyphosphate:nucleotide phosphotransferase